MGIQRLPVFGLALLTLIMLTSPALAAESNALDECLLQAMQTADDNTTIGELRAKCQAEIKAAQTDTTKAEEKKTRKSAVDKRLAIDDKNVLKPFTLMAHKPNYFLFASYTSGGINPEPYREQFNDPTIETDKVEARFQISIKTPLWVNLFGKPIDLYAAYTNRSFWQVYNDDISSPFRETNHEPEGWIQFRPNWEFWGIRNSVNAIGIVHQSNGRGGVLSRSWNRVYANFVFQKPALFTEKDTFAFGIKPWIRISENEEDDDNPDITDYMGHYEIRMAYKIQKHVVSMMLRNNLESGFSRGAIEASWSFPIWKYPYLKGYLQWFNGYGESLIDYNEHNNSIGIGILLTDWL